MMLRRGDQALVVDVIALRGQTRAVALTFDATGALVHVELTGEAQGGLATRVQMAGARMRAGATLAQLRSTVLFNLQVVQALEKLQQAHADEARALLDGAA